MAAQVFADLLRLAAREDVKWTPEALTNAFKWARHAADEQMSLQQMSLEQQRSQAPIRLLQQLLRTSDTTSAPQLGVLVAACTRIAPDAPDMPSLPASSVVVAEQQPAEAFWQGIVEVLAHEARRQTRLHAVD